jgi:hypothetical protein
MAESIPGSFAAFLQSKRKLHAGVVLACAFSAIIAVCWIQWLRTAALPVIPDAAWLRGWPLAFPLAAGQGHYICGAGVSCVEGSSPSVLDVADVAFDVALKSRASWTSMVGPELRSPQ